MLRVGHLNVYHLYSKVPDVCNFLQSLSSSEYHLVGITESRLDFRITDHSISIPDYHITRRDPQLTGQTGIAVFCITLSRPLHTDAKTYKMTKFNVFG